MNINKIERIAYRVNGNEFKSLEKAESYIEDLIGKHIDKLCNRGSMGAKHKIIIHDYLLKNRYELSELLGCRYYDEEEV